VKRSRTVRFKHLRSRPCPACLDRDALNIMGQPAFINGVRLSSGCEVCGGSGRITEGERINGWPHPELWVLYRKDTPKRKAYRPAVLEAGLGIFQHLQ
jgi:hypothetical protein